MSYNQTNKIHNPFEGEELEKGLSAFKEAARYTESALRNYAEGFDIILEKGDDKLYKAVEDIERSIGITRVLSAHGDRMKLSRDQIKEVKQVQKGLLKAKERIVGAISTIRQSAGGAVNIKLAYIAGQLERIEKGK
tara:strand:+ start:17 stop:424 length:408 start_codon:yes stop_codon:yes gene_type:complete